ncbi:hypothetical protein KHP32_22895, partial [Cronobacter sakazakii]|uniref:hypothetical protein n=1 Tax=Cronobacter sakazakii TaxID=28141 RepID=UPI001BCEC2F8
VEFNDKYDRMASTIHGRRDTGSNAPHTLSTLWEVALQQTLKQNPNAFKLLCILAMIAPDEISLSLLDFDHEADGTQLEEALDDYLAFCTDIET